LLAYRYCACSNKKINVEIENAQNMEEKNQHLDSFTSLQELQVVSSCNPQEWEKAKKR
jgi:hypothetical protein